MIFKNWNPWINDRLTSYKTFNKVFSMKNQNILVDPEPDVFSSKIHYKWFRKLTYTIRSSPRNNFFIPTIYPNSPTLVTLGMFPNVWIGLKLTKNNQMSLIDYDKKVSSQKWLYLKNYEETKYNEELFRCTGPEHLYDGNFWKPVYPCASCSGTGLENKYKFDWVVLSGGKKGIDREVVDDFKIHCDLTKIPFYYERAWINGKLIREPLLYGKQQLGLPENIFDKRTKKQ